jgi:hypothetical protein
MSSPEANQANPKLSAAISSLIDELEASDPDSLSITDLSRRFAIKLRRLYDILNVFTALGCCRKSPNGGLTWTGRRHVTSFLREMRQLRGIDEPGKSLTELFPVALCVGMANLAANFLLLFSALRTDSLNLKGVCLLFTRGTAKYRSTLCKLYQIAFVLGAAQITTRTSHVCEVVLLRDYIDFELAPNTVATLPERLNNPLNLSVLRRRTELEAMKQDSECLAE